MVDSLKELMEQGFRYKNLCGLESGDLTSLIDSTFKPMLSKDCKVRDVYLPTLINVSTLTPIRFTAINIQPM